jgi:hypothetical protein
VGEKVGWNVGENVGENVDNKPLTYGFSIFGLFGIKK